MAAPWKTFDETITGMVALLSAARALPRGREALAVRAVTAREAMGSTAILDIGVGVPHARVEGIEMPAVALAVSTAGLYEPVPTVPIQIVALVLSPPVATADHLQILASAALLLRSVDVRAALLRAVDAAEVIAMLTHPAPAGVTVA